MFNGQVQVPIVIRTPVGGGRGYGPTHSQSIEKLFLGVPYLSVVAPTHLHDPGALLKHAILADTGVVLFLEHKLLYGLKLFQSTGPLIATSMAEANGYPTAVLSNFSEGRPDVTLIAYGGLSRLCVPVLERLAAEEIRVQAVFPSSIKPLPIGTLVEMASASGRIVIAEEGTTGFNWGSEVATLLYERLWRRLQTPIKRIASHESILPTAREMEEQVIITAEKIEAAIIEVLG
jgi:pyruvate/2-oxoglutarate/acetoin dehydrogenase E1 component